MCTLYGEDAITDRRCEKLLAKFHTGDFLLEDALWSDRPVEVGRNHIENNQCYTTWKTANIIKIFKSIKLMGENEKCVFYFMEKMQTFWPIQYMEIKLFQKWKL